MMQSCTVMLSLSREKLQFYTPDALLCVCSYNLSQTELFLHALLNDEPVKTVVAPEAPRSDHHRPSSKEREKVFTTETEKQWNRETVHISLILQLRIPFREGSYGF